jgi:hypothetical protein
MPGEPTKLIFGILSTYERNGWHHPSITQFFAEMPMRIGGAYPVVGIANFIPAASGRNIFCRNYKDRGLDWICMIDNDMVVPDNFLDTLKDAPEDADIVVPAFYIWSQAELKCTLCWGWDDAPTGAGPAHLPPGFKELTKAGTGAIFIRPRVFQGMPYPYFKYQWNEDQGLAATEDIPFCLEARELGFKIYGNPSVVVGHYHSVELSSMFPWAEKLYNKNKVLDTVGVSGSESARQDRTESPSVTQVAAASPATAT